MMQLGTRVVLVALGGVMITATASMLVQRWTIRKQGEEMIRDTMRTTILGAENTRQSVSKMRLEHMFADEALKNEAANTRDYTKTKLYETVPVVAAWNSIAATADKQGYIFRVPSEDPRNPKNLPTEHEQYILNELTSKALPEYYEVDEKNNQVLFARPITLTGDCMVCHGDPATSPSRNGKDMLGFQMEGWHEGDHHGMFLLRSDLSKVDAVANAGMLKTALWLVPLTVLIAFGVFFFISAISKRLMALVISLSEGTEQVADAVSQISTANQALSAQTTSQAAALEETSAASEQITGLTRQNAQSSQLAAEQMDRVDDQVKESHKALSELDDSMKEIQSSSHRIEQIIKVIDGIAFQTNILALNAAVEAARAGSAGAGFSVVADEVRSLAQKSSQAARDTAPLIEESINKTLTGGVKLQTVIAAIERISVNASKARSLVADVSLGSQQQATGMAEVAQSVCKMQEGTQANAAGSEESAAASEQLAAQAATMNDIAQQLRMVVEG